MTVRLEFTKATGAGNDFVLLNAMGGMPGADLPQLARALCDRHFGVGADGLLVLAPSKRSDFLMLYYNADGSSGGMCGNGGRCVARFALLEGIAGPRQRFEALGFVYRAEVAPAGSVRLSMKDPAGLRTGLRLSRGTGEPVDGTFIDTGAPHLVVFEDDLERLDVARLGRALRLDPSFAPEGTNVNFVSPEGGSTIRIRTYERGVEAETLACGTGSVASALVASWLRNMESPVRVTVRSGEELTVHFAREGDSWHDIALEGSAHMLFRGTAFYDPVSSRIRRSP
ncbi:MAG TPA: diaminopimelate epimerase [Bacteroidota bacterium]|nr:diaminopimelate epimerase [Bacteroidota bacterium]